VRVLVALPLVLACSACSSKSVGPTVVTFPDGLPTNNSNALPQVSPPDVDFPPVSVAPVDDASTDEGRGSDAGPADEDTTGTDAADGGAHDPAADANSDATPSGGAVADAGGE
jgi:hypothetical protein